MKVLETERLVLRRFTLDDAGFILELVNQPPFLRFIGDKGVRTVEDARGYIRNGPLASYEQYGFGAWLVELKEDGEPIGMCGLFRRDWLDDVDVGFAFLSEHGSRGYAYESARAVLEHARDVLGLPRVVAVTALENPSSIKLLGKLGLRFERIIRFPEGDGEGRLFGTES